MDVGGRHAARSGFALGTGTVARVNAGAINAFFFGRAERKLFGVFHPAQQQSMRSGVILCNPWGQEYLWAHRSFRSLAQLLAAAGHDVLRFDYHGTGDSSGDLDEGDAPSWAEDISTAIDELIDMVGPQKVTLIGLRMGAAWAAAVAARRRDVTRVVAWDPIVDGSAYLRALERVATRDGDDLDVFGFRLTPATREELLGVTAETYERVKRSMLVLETQAEPCAWAEQGSTGMSGLPVKALHHIVEWLS